MTNSLAEIRKKRQQISGNLPAIIDIVQEIDIDQAVVVCAVKSRVDASASNVRINIEISQRVIKRKEKGLRTLTIRYNCP